MNFLFWGTVGLVTEVVFTAFRRLLMEKKIDMTGHTSLWMFPIYALGLSYGVEVLQALIAHDITRYLTYPLAIWMVEIMIGYPASKFGVRIWDYRYLPDKMQWKGIISYVHFPLWVGFGVMVEVLHRYAG